MLSESSVAASPSHYLDEILNGKSCVATFRKQGVMICCCHQGDAAEQDAKVQQIKFKQPWNGRKTKQTADTI
ncbi:hypothetical protein L6452_43355 [Arctium lappa]|uniref:Uncharacterized protein n=1 Tax=Arctium lappa TaxID=4217 RepID=A0ACB8XK59_ARCLA|nr:hypothetical protein L6452_43355 [Arctium lappa]